VDEVDLADGTALSAGGDSFGLVRRLPESSAPRVALARRR